MKQISSFFLIGFHMVVANFMPVLRHTLFCMVRRYEHGRALAYLMKNRYLCK
jgi:hypothetical protein